MKRTLSPLLTMLLFVTVARAQFPAAIKHVIVVFQENRTPDNLFQGLHGLSGSNGIAYDIQNFWVDSNNIHQPLQPVGLATNFDLGHGHSTFVAESTNPSTPIKPGCGGSQSKVIYGCAASTWNQFMYVDNALKLNFNNLYGTGQTHILDAYIKMAQRWGWANFMYQTNQGPSYPAHQFIFGGTSAPTAGQDHGGVFVAENTTAGEVAGCLAPADEMDFLIDSTGNETPYGGAQGDFCFGHDTLATRLDHHLPNPISWKYYAPSAGSIWTAPNSISAICVPDANFANCTGAEWANNVALPFTNGYGAAPFLTDLQNCQLPAVSWVIPSGNWGDHANGNNGLGPSWVAAIVNAVGGFNNNCGYWANTAIVVTWDDWGGWFDHEPPVVAPPPFGGYTYGFRVPLIVISTYTKIGYVSPVTGRDFGSILRMIEGIFLGVANEGTLTFADARATDDLRDFFTGTAQPYGATIPSVQDINYFLTLPQPGPGDFVAPDTD